MKLKIVFFSIFLLVFPAQAAIIEFTGFELGTGEPFQNSSAATQWSIQSVTVKTSANALKVKPLTNAAAGWWRLGSFSGAGAKVGTSVANAFVGFHFRYTIKPTANNEEIYQSQDFGGGNAKIAVRLSFNGKLEAYDSVANLMATGATVLLPNVWYWLEVKSGTGAAAAWEVRINGVSEISGTGNLQTNANATFALGKVQNRNSEAIEYYFDNFVIDSTGYTGEVEVKNLLPTGNGGTAQWTAGTNASNHSEVDEIPADNDTTYIKSTGAAGDVHLVTLQSTTAVGITGTILGVKAIADKREDVTAVSNSSVRLRSSATNSDTTAENSTNQYVYRERLAVADPATGVAWTLAGVDAAQVGVVEANAVAMRCTLLRAAVVYAPVVPTKGGTFLLLGVG